MAAISLYQFQRNAELSGMGRSGAALSGPDGEFRAGEKDLRAELGHAFRQGDGAEILAAAEGPLPDGFHPFGKHHFLQGFTAGKGLLAQALQACGQRDLRQGNAVEKRAHAELTKGGWQRDPDQHFAAGKAAVGNAGDPFGQQCFLNLAVAAGTQQHPRRENKARPGQILRQFYALVFHGASSAQGIAAFVIDKADRGEPLFQFFPILVQGVAQGVEICVFIPQLRVDHAQQDHPKGDIAGLFFHRGIHLRSRPPPS